MHNIVMFSSHSFTARLQWHSGDITWNRYHGLCFIYRQRSLHLARRLQDDLAVEGEAGKQALLKQDDVVSRQAEVVVLAEEVLGGSLGVFAGHYVPGSEKNNPRRCCILK